jgi:hypothetical protein
VVQRQDLEAEIDRLYTAKTSADNEADAAESSASGVIGPHHCTSEITVLCG